MSYYLPPSTDPTGPIGEGNYTMQDGDCIESIAFQTGHAWQTIWNHPNNDSLKTSRASHNILLPGDQLFIPPKVEQTYDRPTDAKHTFVLKGVPCTLKLCLLQAGEPRANEDYTLVIDDTITLTGATDGDGNIEVRIAPNAVKAVLTFGSNPLDLPYTLSLGGMDPITEPTGIQKRLTNLGFHCPVTGQMDDATAAALAMFQKGEDLEATGSPERKTLDKLKTRCGC